MIIIIILILLVIIIIIIIPVMRHFLYVDTLLSNDVAQLIIRRLSHAHPRTAAE